MKGFAMLGVGKVGWIETEVAECGPLDAIVKPIILAPCTSDVHTVWGGQLGDLRSVLGHEAIGEIVEVGKLVKYFKPGDRVIVCGLTPDWSSLEAQAGIPMHSGRLFGGVKFTNEKNGVFAELFHVNDADGNLAILPEGMDPEAAIMLTDMVPTGFRGVELANVGFGDSVAVIGIGPVGLMAVAGAVLRGAARIYAVGSRANCVQLAKEYGATDIINYKEGPIEELILEKTSGQGVDKVIVAGGDENTFMQAMRMVKAGGTVANVNYLTSNDPIRIPCDAWGFGMGDKTLVGGIAMGGRLKITKLANMLEVGRIDVSKLITHRFEGLEGIEPALMLMKNKSPDVIKPIVIV